MIMAVKREILILRPAAMTAEQAWEQCMRLVGMLTIYADAHFVTEKIPAPGALAEMLGRVDYAVVFDNRLDTLLDDGYVVPATFAGVIALGGAEDAARRLVGRIVVDGAPCRVLTGDDNAILKQILER